MNRVQTDQNRKLSINAKAQAVSNKLRPTNLKRLRSFLGAVNQVYKFIPNLASKSLLFRTILKKDADWNWNQDHGKYFLENNDEIKKVLEFSHFKRNQEIRITCDVSKEGLGAVLQQSQKNVDLMNTNLFCVKIFIGL